MELNFELDISEMFAEGLVRSAANTSALMRLFQINVYVSDFVSVLDVLNPPPHEYRGRIFFPHF